MTQTFKLQIRQTNLYDANEGFQLILRAMEQNRDMFIWEDASVAACKTAAANVFVVTNILWTGDKSTGLSGGGQLVDVLWADAWFTLGTAGLVTMIPVESAGTGV